eukprot:TRINITY_DN74978_c0_g1_i1.p1 TRINITY_DN74978_c0_g1~~TRINITY_DN74978_c0_g1_i1.p1  ORF type:complete len:197 (-),score=37.40 TRINITY_DN74978_c0_g1_i1:135-725(-)
MAGDKSSSEYAAAARHPFLTDAAGIQPDPRQALAPPPLGSTTAAIREQQPTADSGAEASLPQLQQQPSLEQPNHQCPQQPACNQEMQHLPQLQQPQQQHMMQRADMTQGPADPRVLQARADAFEDLSPLKLGTLCALCLPIPCGCLLGTMIWCSNCTSARVRRREWANYALAAGLVNCCCCGGGAASSGGGSAFLM